MGGQLVLQQYSHLDLSHVLARVVAAVVERLPVLSHACAQSGPSSAEMKLTGKLRKPKEPGVGRDYTLIKNCPSSVSIIEDACGNCDGSKDCGSSARSRSRQEGYPQPC
jgi:hypothetical protein